jgi:hypothetical protein
LTVWDLDDGRAPGIRGQLHVMMLDNDETSADDIYIKHYTNAIRVDALNESFQNGTPGFPFRTVDDALGLAWPNSEIRIRANHYIEALIVSKRVRLTSEGGVTRIGD